MILGVLNLVILVLNLLDDNKSIVLAHFFYTVYANFYMRIFALGTYAYMAHARDSKSIVLAHFFMGRLCLFAHASYKRTDIDPSPDTGSSPRP